VDRNRIKRLVRESFRQYRSELAALDIVVLVKPGIEQADNRALLQALRKHWLRLNRDAHP
jgi:ribonuclease P protein component